MENEKITVEMLRRITEEKRAEIKAKEEEKFNEFINSILIECKENAKNGYNGYEISLEETEYFLSTVESKFRKLGFKTKVNYIDNSIQIFW